jgi:hydrogenase maturation factor
MRLVEIDAVTAVAEVDGVTRQVSLDLLPEVAWGDYALIQVLTSKNTTLKHQTRIFIN